MNHYLLASIHILANEQDSINHRLINCSITIQALRICPANQFFGLWRLLLCSEQLVKACSSLSCLFY